MLQKSFTLALLVSLTLGVQLRQEEATAVPEAAPVAEAPAAEKTQEKTQAKTEDASTPPKDESSELPKEVTDPEPAKQDTAAPAT